MGDRKDLGFVAEELAKVVPELAQYDSEGNLSGVRYEQMTALLAKSIQELKRELDEKGKIIEELQEKLERI
jgi:predicted RNase H-like nuclease (RuvC/YqgF family)